MTRYALDPDSTDRRIEASAQRGATAPEYQASYALGMYQSAYRHLWGRYQSDKAPEDIPDSGSVALRIGASWYELRLPPDRVDMGYAVSLYKSDGTEYTCTADGTATRDTNREGLSCTCPDFKHRHAGPKGDEGRCKHLAALVSADVLHPIPCPTLDDDWRRELDDTRAEVRREYAATRGV